MRAVIVFLALVCSLCAWGHDPQLSGIGISTKAGVTTLAVQAHLGKLSGDPEKDIERRLQLRLDGLAFVPHAGHLNVDQAAGVAYWTEELTTPVRDVEVSQRLFPEDPNARTIVSITREGETVSETLLDATNPSMTLSKGEKKGVGDVIRQFTSLGVMHIFTGPDHILFIFGLILVGGSLRGLLKTVTAFTVAHSITLTVAALGLWTPASRYIEPLIALSIVVVALENLRRRPEGARDWRPVIAFAFGLIHGFGFAGGLTEAGLPHGALGWALASFNIGVECAQAVIVLSVFPVLAWLARTRPLMSRRVVVLGSCAISVAGGFWFVDRVRATEVDTTGAKPVASLQVQLHNDH